MNQEKNVSHFALWFKREIYEVYLVQLFLVQAFFPGNLKAFSQFYPGFSQSHICPVLFQYCCWLILGLLYSFLDAWGSLEEFLNICIFLMFTIQAKLFLNKNIFNLKIDLCSKRTLANSSEVQEKGGGSNNQKTIKLSLPCANFGGLSGTVFSESDSDLEPFLDSETELSCCS